MPCSLTKWIIIPKGTRIIIVNWVSHNIRFTTSLELQEIINEHYTFFLPPTYNFREKFAFLTIILKEKDLFLAKHRTKGVGSLQLIGKLLCWRRNVWVIVSCEQYDHSSVLMKELFALFHCHGSKTSLNRRSIAFALCPLKKLVRTDEKASQQDFLSFHEWNLHLLPVTFQVQLLRWI